MERREIRIAYIGGGSVEWARKLMSDLALCPQLTGALILHDIDMAAAEANVRRGQQLFSLPTAQTRFHVEACADLATTLKGADFVVLSIQPGPIEMFASDLDIPLKYGLLQTVGDTVGPGGLSRALRSIPLYESFAHAIMQHCPNAWVINYTNPMTVCTATLYAAEPEIKAFGCCHEVFGTQARLAKLVNGKYGVSCQRQEIHLDINGVNHFTWAIAASYKGQDLFPLIREHIAQADFFADQTATAQERQAAEMWFYNDGRVAFDLFRRFGALGAAGDRHLVEFVPWYLRDEATLHRWGVIATPSSYRLLRQRLSRQENQNPPPVTELQPSGEEGVLQMLALTGLAPLDSNVNIPNRGQAPDLPFGAVVETNAAFRENSLVPLQASPLPAGANVLVRRIVGVQQLTLAAGLTRDKELALQALLNDPLVRLSTDQAWNMLNEMLVANKNMLPGWTL